MTDNPTRIDRICGSCHACCIHVGVRAFNKPVGQPCHLIQLNSDAPESGCCGDYGNRPNECRVYSCGWMDGHFSDDMRPDQCGLIFERAVIFWPKTLTILMGWEIDPDAWRKHEERIAGSLPESTVAGVITQGGELTLCGRPDDIAAYNEWMEECRQRGGFTSRMADGEFEVQL